MHPTMAAQCLWCAAQIGPCELMYAMPMDRLGGVDLNYRRHRGHCRPLPAIAGHCRPLPAIAIRHTHTHTHTHKPFCLLVWGARVPTKSGRRSHCPCSFLCCPSFSPSCFVPLQPFSAVSNISFVLWPDSTSLSLLCGFARSARGSSGCISHIS